MGIYGNERVDALAKSASSLNSDIYNKLLKEDYYKLIHAAKIRMWNLDWHRSVNVLKKGKFLFDVKSEIKYWPWTNLEKRIVETSIARLRTGHAGVNQYLFRFHQSESPLCPCGELETIIHYLLFCPIFNL